MAFIIIGLCISALVMIFGVAWALRFRGTTTRREGAEIGAEIMAENLDRRSRMDGEHPLFQKTFFIGKGWAINREAAYSYKEIKEKLGTKDYLPIIPVFIMFIGILGLSIFLGLLMFEVFDSKVYGFFYFIFLIYGLYVVVSGFIKS